MTARDARSRCRASRRVAAAALGVLVLLPFAATEPWGVRGAPQETPPPEKLARVLLLTGRDVPAHDWRATTAVTRRILEETRRFEVVVVEEPAVLETRALMDYDVLLVNYRNPPTETLSEAARQNVEAFVKRGKGLVALHFAVNAWEDWGEYRKMIGRYWVRRRAGKKVSGHGPQGTFRVTVKEESHPIVRGLAAFETNDELYARLEESGAVDVVVSARSEWSGRTEPLAWTVTYGAGRVFVLALGHDVPSRQNAGFQHLLRRGCEWAGHLLPAR